MAGANAPMHSSVRRVVVKNEIIMLTVAYSLWINDVGHDEIPHLV